MVDTAVADTQAAAMDRMYRYTRHVYDLTRKPYLLGRDRMIARLDAPAGGTVLELGCGTGRNLIAVAEAAPTARLYGIDISEEMLKTARLNVARAGLADRIRLVQGDATGFDAAAAFGIAQFDRVYVSYALSMIPDWTGALREGLRLTAADGRFAMVDFGLCRGLPGWFRAGLGAWLGLFHVTPRASLEAELVRVARERGSAVAVEHPLGGYAQLGIVG